MSEFVRIPIEEIQKVKDGYTTVTDSWWPVVEGCVMFYRTGGRYSPQCNRLESIAWKIGRKLFKDSTECAFLPVAYVPQ